MVMGLEKISQYEWRYRTGSTTRHALSEDKPRTACSLFPRVGVEWLGTGSQKEYERAAKLPMCSYCASYLGIPKPPKPVSAVAMEPVVIVVDQDDDAEMRPGQKYEEDVMDNWNWREV